MNDNIKTTEHPEQDPAEGAPDIVDRELKRQDDRAGQRAAAGKPTVGRPADRPPGASPQH